MKESSRWSAAHTNLKRIYDARVPEGVTQKAFGARYGIGSQSMVAQYLNGTRPLNYESAAKFARGLGCTIYDISPEMADSLKEDILPLLGRALRRAAALACFAIVPLTAPTPADAAVGSASVYYVKLTVAWVRRWLRKWLPTFAALTIFNATATERAA